MSAFKCVSQTLEAIEKDLAQHPCEALDAETRELLWQQLMSVVPQLSHAVTRAQQSERDPDTAIYGAGMIARIKAADALAHHLARYVAPEDFGASLYESTFACSLNNESVHTASQTTALQNRNCANISTTLCDKARSISTKIDEVRTAEDPEHKLTKHAESAAFLHEQLKDVGLSPTGGCLTELNSDTIATGSYQFAEPESSSRGDDLTDIQVTAMGLLNNLAVHVTFRKSPLFTDDCTSVPVSLQCNVVLPIGAAEFKKQITWKITHPLRCYRSGLPSEVNFGNAPEGITLGILLFCNISELCNIACTNRTLNLTVECNSSLWCAMWKNIAVCAPAYVMNIEGGNISDAEVEFRQRLAEEADASHTTAATLWKSLCRRFIGEKVKAHDEREARERRRREEMENPPLRPQMEIPPEHQWDPDNPRDIWPDDPLRNFLERRHPPDDLNPIPGIPGFIGDPFITPGDTRPRVPMPHPHGPWGHLRPGMEPFGRGMYPDDPTKGGPSFGFFP